MLFCDNIVLICAKKYFRSEEVISGILPVSY